MDIIADSKMFGGRQLRVRHPSQACQCDMTFSLFLPPLPEPTPDQEAKAPLLTFLSGLTCTDENFTTKAGAQRRAAELGLAILAPDTSPRGDGVPDDPNGAYDFGLGAGFYVNATQSPWATNYNMARYVSEELPALVAEHFPIDAERQSISGHSMGGHGALTLALRTPGKYRSVSAFAPIVAPMSVPWGEKALTGYLGDDRSTWAAYDTCALVEATQPGLELFVDQGDADTFLTEQLRPELLEAACAKSGHSRTIRMQPGYDHSYNFIATFIGDHLDHHAKALGIG